MVQYGGQHKSTDEFQKAECNVNIKSANKIGFWCDWSAGDGSVMMIGGGRRSCTRADHGILWCSNKESSIPVLLVDFMDPLEIINIFLFRTILELKNVE